MPHGPGAAVLRRARLAAAERRLVAAGLAPKLFSWQLPDGTELWDTLENVWEASAGSPDAVAATLVLARGIRGSAGIRWFSEEFFDKGLFKMLSAATPSDEKIRIRHVAKEALLRHDRHTHQQGLSRSWAAHREGRHVRFSGRHFLQAASSLEGSKGAWQVIQRMADVLRQCLAAVV